MYFYNSLLLIINILILTIHIQSQKQKGPGISGCYYIVSDCNESVTISQLPDDCSSLMFSRLTVDLNYHIYGDSSSSENNAKYLGNITKINVYSVFTNLGNTAFLGRIILE
ncbi:uncharacterized protein LOC111041428 [Myzus persicae]|uniref:uncharacterized protein LOC111041428 n=1 Tax=Myzus persicae TaxID=13164 RepID=UPI000B937705|nr:uncharacterized protein LOC111041428 [Myzus persicae]